MVEMLVALVSLSHRQEVELPRAVGAGVPCCESHRGRRVGAYWTAADERGQSSNEVRTDRGSATLFGRSRVETPRFPW